MSIEADVVTAAEKYPGGVVEQQYVYELCSSFEDILEDREYSNAELKLLIERFTKTIQDEKTLMAAYLK